VAEPVVQTQDLVKVFKDFWMRPKAKALDGVSLTVETGEVFGLLGPNGSGKSTTIKILLGLLFPTRGQAAVFGRPPVDSMIRQRVGFLPEESYLYPYLTAWETLDFYGRLFRLDREERDRRNDALLRLTGLLGAKDRYVGEFSKGMARRVGIAQALINNPDLVILDEPTTGLDPIGTREIKDLILELKEKGKTILLSSHLLADVEDVCDRVAILYGGTIHAEGRTEELLRAQHLTQITADLDEETVAEIRQLIQRRVGGDAMIEIGPPAERLERFFLRVVEEARSAREETSGVDGGLSTGDFLGREANADGGILEQLSRPEEPESASEAETAPSRAAEAGRPGGDLLDSLSRPRDEEEPSASDESPAPTRPPEASGSEPGRPDVLERLTSPGRMKPESKEDGGGAQESGETPNHE
jgi:ABC-2 type transport system ATP-binding protein